MVYVFDTNAVIYFLQGKGKFPEFSASDEVVVSSITRLELLSGPLPVEEVAQAEAFLSQVRECQVSRDVIDKAILQRKSKRVRVPDAIILATALQEGALLITADKDLIKNSGDIRCHDPLA